MRGANRVFAPRPACTLLVDAQHHSISRRMKIQTANLLHLGSELGVRTVKPHTNTMRSNLCFIENPNHRGATHGGSRVSTTKPLQQRIDGPHIPSLFAEVRRTPTSHAEQLTSTKQSDLWRSARTGFVFQSFFMPFFDKAIAPATYRLDVYFQSLCCRTHAGISLENQEDSSSKNFTMRAAIVPSNLQQLFSLSRCQTYRSWSSPSSLFLHAPNLITSAPKRRPNNWGENFRTVELEFVITM